MLSDSQTREKVLREPDYPIVVRKKRLRKNEKSSKNAFLIIFKNNTIHLGEMLLPLGKNEFVNELPRKSSTSHIEVIQSYEEPI